MARGRQLPLRSGHLLRAVSTAGHLSGVRVLEVGGGLAAAYTTKLLVDLGASADVIEPVEDHGLSSEGAASGGRAPLFEYLRANCRRVAAKPPPHDVEQLGVFHGAEITISALPPGRWAELARSLPPSSQPRSVLVHISAFGQTGPRSGFRATSLTLQALAGWPRRLAGSDGRPCFAGGDIDAYGTGVHAAAAALTAWRHATRTSSSVEADVAAFECLVAMLPYPTVHAEILTAAGVDMSPVTQSLPGIVASTDGWVGVNPLNQQGWNDLCEVMGLPEFRDRLRELLSDASRAEEFRARAIPWFEARDGDTIVELMQSMRIPSSRVFDGRGLLEHPQLKAREALTEQGATSCVAPRSPWRFSASPVVGERPRSTTRSVNKSTWGGGRPGLPYSDLKVFDLSVYWAGPIITMYLAAFGADVIKVESHKRPDPFRYSTSSPELGADWWERSAVWQGTNLGKRGLTLDLSQQQGQHIARRFIAKADVLIENFTPRVLPQLGIDVDAARAENAALIVVRLPGFGSDGPWRDHVAWAPTLEQASGLAHVTGFESGPPVPPGGCADPLSGMHGLLGLQAALEHRDRTGEGQVVEMSQLEALVTMTAEQVITASLGSEPPGRHGNRNPTIAPHGIYPCSGHDEWIAIAALDDEWKALTELIGRSDLLSDPRLADPEHRRLHHDDLDKSISTWTSHRSVNDAEADLDRAGVTAAPVAYAAHLRDDDQLRERQFFQAIDRPTTATYRYPAWPMRFSFGPSLPHAHAAPTLGEHTDELLEHVLHLSAQEIERLRTAGVIGDAVSGQL